MTRSDQLLQTIETVHAAGLDGQLWPDALEAILHTVGGIAATLEVFDRQTATLTDFHSFGLPEPNELAYFDHYFASNPRIPHLINGKAGGIITDYMVMDERAMSGNEFYSDFLGSTDYRYFIGGTMNASASRSVLFSVQRATKQGHVDRAEVAVMQRLLPHVRMAYEVTQRLGQTGETERSLKSAFDMLTDGVALASGDGAILHANEAMHCIFRQGDGLCIARNGTLEYSAATARRHYDKAFASACKVGNGESQNMDGTEFSVPRPSRAPAYIVSLSPVFRHARKGGLGQQADVIIFVRDPLMRNRSGINILRQAFGFTDAEAHVAQALQAAIPLADYAKEHGISINTVYTHLRAIKDKTRCRRQGELVRLLNDIVMPLRRD